MGKAINMKLQFEDVVQIMHKVDEPDKVTVVINYNDEIYVYNRKMHPIGYGNKMVNLNNNRIEFTPDLKLIAVKRYGRKKVETKSAVDSVDNIAKEDITDNTLVDNIEVTDTTCNVSDSATIDEEGNPDTLPITISEDTANKIIEVSEDIEDTDVSAVKNVKQESAKEEIRHAQMDNIKSCIELNIPVYLYGPAGSGKNYTAKKIAEELNLDFYFTNSVQQEYKITGFIDAGGKYHETEFFKAFKNGGLFMLDEMDASIPEVLVLLNAAIANRYFEFPCGRIEAHENFRVIAAGNTIGSGADTQYTGRMVLDSSTLDRFVIIEFDYDERIEMSIANDNKDLVDFVHFMREQNDMYDLNCTFSYRCLEYITKLEKTNMSLVTILQISIVKGLKKDDISVLDFKQENIRSNKYAKAMRDLAA